MLTIGKLGRSTGVKVPTIRYYEQIGLLPPPERSTGNQRLYPAAAQLRLSFIRHARDLGFPLESIRELLGLADQPADSCAAADEIARRQLAAVEARIARLTSLRGELQRMLAQCACGTIAECRVIEVLGNHALCAHEHEAAEAGPGAVTPDHPPEAVRA
ncbi:helix-turn-helix domain-containing protein [Paracoccus sp. (in: a-proteobacteria)]|uniref:MerR family transcriptional regulator n=1 Tax=Paracoccus sp. TaxID=267 RepID=UPI00321F62B0